MVLGVACVNLGSRQAGQGDLQGSERPLLLILGNVGLLVHNILILHLLPAHHHHFRSPLNLR